MGPQKKMPGSGLRKAKCKVIAKYLTVSNIGRKEDTKITPQPTSFSVSSRKVSREDRES